MLSDECRRLLEGVPRRPDRGELSLDANRQSLRDLIPRLGSPHPTLQVDDHVLGGDVSVRTYGLKPTTEASRPCLVFAHGGGWALGDLDTHDAFCRRVAATAGCVIVSVDYRRPPEHVFPTALHDVLSVMHEVRDRAADWRIDPHRIAVGGDSAGGNLAAAACLAARNTGGAPCHQLLVAPVLDNRPELWGSYTEHAVGSPLTRGDMEWYFSQYLGPGWRQVDSPLAAPLRASNLAGLPPATVLLAQCDPLRDEGRAFVLKLQSAGVPCVHREEPGTFHNFYLFAELEAAQRATTWIAQQLREAFSVGGATAV